LASNTMRNPFPVETWKTTLPWLSSTGVGVGVPTQMHEGSLHAKQPFGAPTPKNVTNGPARLVVGVHVAVMVRVGVAVADAVADGVVVGVIVLVPVDVAVRVSVADWEKVGAGVDVEVRVGDRVGDIVGVALGIGEFVAVRVAL